MILNTATLLFGLALVSASPVSLERRDGLAPLLTAPNNVTGKYIVVLNDNAKSIKVAALSRAVTSGITTTFSSVINGFAGEFDHATVKLLRSSLDVKYIEPVIPLSLDAQQKSAPYNLVFASSAGKQSDPIGNNLDNYWYRTLNRSTTPGFVFVLDSGIRINATEFSNRAFRGNNYLAQYEANEDFYGHGTHVAGTIIATTWGIVKNGYAISIKVFNGLGWSSNEIVLQGLQYVIDTNVSRSVINFSGGGGYSQALNDGFARARAAGYFPVVAAGNEKTDACTRSPASERSVITVGAIDPNYAVADFSNYGSCVDYFAAGVNIPSVDRRSDSAPAYLSGTSMAAPIVAGLISYFLKAFPNDDPLALLAKSAKKNYIPDSKGSPNLVADNGFWSGLGGN